MKTKIAASSLLVAHPIVATSDKTTTSLTREVDSVNKNKSALVKQSRLSSPSFAGRHGNVPQKGLLPDVGVLGRRMQRSDSSAPHLFKKHKKHRFLQDSFAAPVQDDATCLKPDTCEPKLCECVGNDGDAYTCAQELHAVCQGVTSQARNADEAQTWTIDGCVDERRLKYYLTIYCPFASCLATGGTYNACSCDHFYKPYCEQYGDVFAESETTQLYCQKANCCAAATDDAGRALCLEDDSSAITGDSSEPVPNDAAHGDSHVPLTIPNSNSPDPSVPNKGPAGVSAASPNGATTASHFGALSAFTSILVFFLNAFVN
jgi:hypothetical protein